MNILSRSLRMLFMALALTAFMLPSSAQAQSNAEKAQQIRTMLDQRDKEIKSLLQGQKTLPAADREKLKSMINSVIDFRAMARTALGPHWNELSASQQKEFVDVFSEIVRSQSLANLDVYRATVRYDAIDVNGNEARVSTSATFKDVPTRVDYVMSFRDGKWLVDDVILDEVSTAEGYARSFQPVVKRRGFDSLMTSLRKKLESVAARS